MIYSLIWLFLGLLISIQSVHTKHESKNADLVKIVSETSSKCSTCLSKTLSIGDIENETNDTKKSHLNLEKLKKTLIIIKPDGYYRGLIGECFRRFENKRFRIVGIKLVQASNEIIEHHYNQYKGTHLMMMLKEYMTSGPLLIFVLEGLDVIAQARKIMGATNPKNQEVGTIRQTYSTDTTRNIIHASASESDAENEIKFWFRPDEILNDLPFDNLPAKHHFPIEVNAS